MSENLNQNNEFKEEDLNHIFKQLEQYELKETVKSHQVFGEHKVYIQKNNTLKGVTLFSKEFKTNLKQEAIQFNQKCKEWLQQNQSRWLIFIDYQSQIKKGFCTTSYVIEQFFEQPQLINILQEKQEMKMIKMSKDLLLSLQEFEKDGQHHGNIDPYHIGFYQEKNSSILIEGFNEQKSIEQIQFQKLNNKQDLYICPNLFQIVQNKSKDKFFDKKLNDLFALGLVILQLSTNQSLQEFYLDKGEVDHNFLQKQGNLLKQKTQQKYQLFNLVSYLLNCNQLVTVEHSLSLLCLKTHLFCNQIQSAFFDTESKQELEIVEQYIDEQGRKVTIKKQKQNQINQIKVDKENQQTKVYYKQQMVKEIQPQQTPQTGQEQHKITSNESMIFKKYDFKPVTI